MKNKSLSALLFLFIAAFFFSSCKDNSTGLEDNSPFYPVILKTTDGGNQWVSISHEKFESVPAYNDITDMNFFNDKSGIAVARDGIIYRYDAAADFWWKVAGLESINFSSIDILDSTSCVAVGNVNSNGSRIIRTNDKGIHWMVVNENNSSNLFKVDFIDAQYGFVLAGSNYLCKTSDFGSSWNWLPIVSASFDLWDLKFLDSQKGFVVGSYNNSSNLSKTTNGGNNWSSQNIFQGTGQSAYKIKFYNISTGFAIGNGNVAAKTTDGGDTWNNLTVTSNSNMIMRDLAIVSENKIFIIGINTLYKSIDGGANWTSYIFPTSEYPTVIRFIDENTGYITGRFDHTISR
jgi:photosystem II stability/assembly factor-like uncharacterized protein